MCSYVYCVTIGSSPDCMPRYRSQVRIRHPSPKAVKGGKILSCLIPAFIACLTLNKLNFYRREQSLPFEASLHYSSVRMKIRFSYYILLQKIYLNFILNLKSTKINYWRKPNLQKPFRENIFVSHTNLENSAKYSL